MITGYNTDVRHNEVVFHVQTEDKGTENPFIESLVYVGGQVLAAKRASYANLLTGTKEERAVVELMERQHRTVIAAIKNGRFDAKLEARLSGAKGDGTGAHGTSETMVSTAVAEPKPEGAETPLERTLDEVILEYLTSEADQEQLVLTVDSDAEFVLGEPTEISLHTTSSKTGKPITGARVQVRMISTVADPQSLASGETDAEGTLALAFRIPSLGRGTAALIVTASSPVGSAEIKHLL